MLLEGVPAMRRRGAEIGAAIIEERGQQRGARSAVCNNEMARRTLAEGMAELDIGVGKTAQPLARAEREGRIRKAAMRITHAHTCQSAFARLPCGCKSLVT